jgi:opacity protein-like surface antigen
MKSWLVIAALGAALMGSAQAAPWQFPRFDVQDGRGGGGGGGGGNRERGGGGGAERPGGGREARQEQRPQRDERQGRLNDDERRALHRDLDKANRELYRRPDR